MTMTTQPSNIDYAIFFDSLVDSPKTSSALHCLVEHYNLNRNFLIFCIWFAKTGRGRLRKSVLRERLHASFVWQQAIVIKLHCLLGRLNEYLPRTHLSSHYIEQVKRISAKTYRQAEQLCLLNEPSLYYATQRILIRQLGDAIANLLMYLSLVQVSLTEDHVASLLVLLGHAFPEVDFDKLNKIWFTALERQASSELKKGGVQQHLPL